MAPPQTCRFITSQSGALTSWDCIHWTGSERIFGQVVFHLFPIRVTWPVVSDNLPGALPTEFSLRPVGASVWRVGSAPGDSKGRPGLRTWLLVHLWELRPGFSPSRGNNFCSAWALKGQVSAAHTPHVSRIWGTLYEERRVDNNNKLIDWSPRRSWLSWISPETKDRRGWRFPAFQGPSACEGVGSRRMSCAGASEGVISWRWGDSSTVLMRKRPRAAGRRGGNGSFSGECPDPG